VLLKNNILHISPNFNFACGVSKHVFTNLTSDELKKNFNLHFITNGGDALKKLDDAGIIYTIMNFKTDKLFHFEIFRNLKWLRKYCKENKINIIHSHHRYPALLAYLVSKSLGIKTILTAHDYTKRLTYLSYRSDRIVSVSYSVMNHLNKYFKISKSKVDVLYNCIKIEKNQKANGENIKSLLNIPSRNRLLLYTGRIIEEKGIDTLVDAFNLIIRDFEDVELVLIGEIKLPEKILSKVSANTKVHLLSAMGKIDDFYKISDIVVLPSMKEGLGYTMLEAGLFKIPFIGSKTGGISEFIEDEVNGYLFEPGNVKGLANRIKYVITHPKEALASAEILQEKVRRECNCEHYFKKLSSIYSNLLEN